jgi:hypothetical protein
VTCGLRRPSAAASDGVGAALPGLIQRNVALIGHCLGTPADLEHALAAWTRPVPVHRVVDAVPGQAAAFFDATFNDPARVGKVVGRHV